MNVTLENETVPATLTLTSPSSLQILTVWTRELSPQGQICWRLPCHLATSTRAKGAYKTLHFQRWLPPDVPAPGTKAPHQMWSPGSWRVGALGAHSCRWWGHQHNLGEWMSSLGKGRKKHVTFLFSRLKSLSFRVREGIVALTLFFGRRVAACQRQLHMGSFTLHAASGFRGKLFLFLDHLPL